MVSFVSRHYMRGESGGESLMVCLCNGAAVCLGYLNKKTKNVQIKYIQVEIVKSKNELFEMSYILIYFCCF